MVDEQNDRLIIKQHTSDYAPNTSNLIIKQILNNLTFETGQGIN
jgi:hypothetical protein